MEEEDVWDLDLDFTGNESEEEAHPGSMQPEMTIAEIMEVRYLRAEKEKELVCLEDRSILLGSSLTDSRRVMSLFAVAIMRPRCAITKQRTRWSQKCRIIN